MQRFKKGSSLMLAVMIAVGISTTANAKPLTAGYGHGCPSITKEVKNYENQWV